MNFDMVHSHQKFGNPNSYRKKDMTPYNFWVTNDPMDFSDRKK